MDSFQSYGLYLSILLFTILLLFKTVSRHHCRHLNLPPGPKPWPIIGNLNLIGSLPHRSIRNLSLRYGPIMQLQLGSVPHVVGSSVSAACFFLKTHDLSFATRPKTAAGKYTTYNYSDITWSPYGAHWKQFRKMCFMELFNVKRLESYEYIRVEERLKLTQDMFKSSGSGEEVFGGRESRGCDTQRVQSDA